MEHVNSSWESFLVDEIWRLLPGAVKDGSVHPAYLIVLILIVIGIVIGLFFQSDRST